MVLRFGNRQHSQHGGNRHGTQQITAGNAHSVTLPRNG
jgi:hypothetical protein